MLLVVCLCVYFQMLAIHLFVVLIFGYFGYILWRIYDLLRALVFMGLTTSLDTMTDGCFWV